MPLRLFSGGAGNFPLETYLLHAERTAAQESRRDFPGSRHVMGYRLPNWQRPAVWTEAQQARFIESCYLGLDIGRFVVTQANFDGFQGPLDNLLLDGQQRLTAIEAYLADQFPVYGYRWSELGEIDRRLFHRQILPTITICTDQPWNGEVVDEAFLRDLYIRMNYGGTAHAPEHHPDVVTVALTPQPVPGEPQP